MILMYLCPKVKHVIYISVSAGIQKNPEVNILNKIEWILLWNVVI